MGIFYEALVRWVGQANSVMAMGSTFVDRRVDPGKKKKTMKKTNKTNINKTNTNKHKHKQT